MTTYQGEALIILEGGLVTDVAGVRNYEIFDWDVLESGTYEEVSEYLRDFPGGEEFTLERVREYAEDWGALEQQAQDRIVAPLFRAYNKANGISDAEN